MSWKDTIQEEDITETKPLETSASSSWKDSIQEEDISQPEVEPMEVSDVITPTGGTIYKGTKTVTQTIPESFLKAGEIAAQKIGGLSPEQVEYYKQNYKAMEASGMTPEAIQETMSKVESTFREKNRMANEIRKQAEASMDIPLTKNLAEEAAARAIPKTLDKIDTETETFKKLLDEKTKAKVESEIDRLTNLLEQKKQSVIDSYEYAQLKAEKAAEEAVKKAKPIITPGTLELEPVNTQEIYKKAFEEELKKTLPEQNRVQAKAIEDFKKYSNQISDLSNEYYQATNIMPEVQKQIIRTEQTPLAKEYKTARGYRDIKKIAPQIPKLTETYGETTAFTGPRAAEELRRIRAMGWSKTGQVSDEAAKIYAEELRKLLAPEGSTADIEYKKVSNLLNQLKEAQQSGFISRDTGKVISGIPTEGVDDIVEDQIVSKFQPESVKVGQEEQQYIKRVMNPSAKDLQNVDIQEGRKIFEKLIDDPKLVEEVRQAAIKMDLLDPSKAAKFGATDAFRIMIGTGLGQFGPVLGYEAVKGLKTPTGAYKAATFGSRVAEAIPQSLKTFGKVAGKALPIVGAGVGAYMGYQEAKEEGLPEWAAIPYAGFEAISPVPISPIQAKKAMEYSAQERAKSIQQNLQMSPEELQKSKERSEYLKNILPEWMTKKEESKTKAPTTQVLKADNPAEIGYLAQAMQNNQDKASQEYGRVLSQIVDAPAREKESILFGLNQQPAFRELVRKLKGESEE